MVYFTLADSSDVSQAKFVAACQKYLNISELLTHFSVGTRATQYARPVNDVDYDVTINLIFKDSAAHDTYQTHPEHKKFIAECQPMWKKARVFDSFLR
jgi:hypothetical protein